MSAVPSAGADSLRGPPARGPLRSLVLAAALATALPGCLVVGGSGTQGPALPADLDLRLVRGHTTRAEVLALLGPPNEYRSPELSTALVDDTLRLSDALAVARRAERAWTWQYDRVDSLGTMLLLYNRFAASTATDLLVVWFDADGLVAEWALRHETED